MLQSMTQSKDECKNDLILRLSNDIIIFSLVDELLKSNSMEEELGIWKESRIKEEDILCLKWKKKKNSKNEKRQTLIPERLFKDMKWKTNTWH